MSENSLTRALFMDGRPEFPVTGSRGRTRYAPAASPHVFAFVAAAADFVVLSITAALLGRHAFSSSLFLPTDLSRQSAIILFALLFMYGTNLYRVEIIGSYRLFLRGFARAWTSLLAALMIIGAIPALFSISGSNNGHANNLEMILLWFTATGSALVFVRYAVTASFHYAVAQALLVHNVVLVGATAQAAAFIKRVRRDRLGVRVRAVFDEQPLSSLPRTLAGVPVHGNADDLLAYHKRHEIDTVVVALPLQNHEDMRDLVKRLSLQPLKIALLPGALTLQTRRVWCAPFGDLPGVHLMSIRDLPIERSGLLMKAMFDRLAAGLALLLFGPVMLGCAIGIKLASPGPIFYRQRRIGYRNREFNIFKFRSMHCAACDSGKLTVRNDPRVFGFGQLMRKLSLDELPQLFNVMRGDMSMVGPRPHMPEATAAGQLYFDVVLDYAARHRVKPGITGWAQINGWRGPTETLHQIEQRVAHDLFYIDNWSFLLDMKILAKTAFVGFVGKNAF